MTGLDTPMQTKALNLFWHKAELRLVEQAEPEAPVFAISRPTFFGGREEFLLQYPARLEPPTERDLARHRFTVRHGKKRRSFQAPDAATFDAWLGALELALEPKRESERLSTPRTTTSNATTATSSHGRASNAVNSQGRASIAGSTGTRASSRGRAGTVCSNVSSQRSNASSIARAPPLRLTLERPCFTRDPKNSKLIRLHRPAWVVSSTAEDEDELDDFEVDNEPEETESEGFHSEDTEPVIDDEDAHDEGSIIGVEDASDKRFAVADDDTDLTDVEEDFLVSEDEGENNEVLSAADDTVADFSEIATEDSTTSKGQGVIGEIDIDVKAVVESLVAAVVAEEAKSEVTNADGENEDVDRHLANDTNGDIEREVKAAVEALVSAVIEKNEDNEGAMPSDVAIASAWASRSFEKAPLSNTSTRSATLVTKHKWVPMDPTNSRLIWVRCLVETDVKSAPRTNPRRKGIKPARRWVPVDPSSTRLIWIRRVENAAARIESRYKATAHTRKWVPLDADNSKLIWVRRQVVPVGGVANSLANSSTSRLYPFRHGNRRHHWQHRH